MVSPAPTSVEIAWHKCNSGPDAELHDVALGLQTFITAGEKETRAWTIRRGTTAPEAAGVIHSDFQKHFIRAEVVSFDDLVEAGSLAAVRAAGRARIEGKEYVMAEGDVVEFRVGA